MSTNEETKVVEEIKETAEDVKEAAEETCACCDAESCDEICDDECKCPFAPKELSGKQKAIAIGAAAGLLALGAAAVALVFFYRNKKQ